MQLKIVFNEPWRFVLQVRLHMITHVKMTDEVLEQEIQQPDNYIRSHHLTPVINRLIYGITYNRKRGMEDERVQNILKNKSLHHIIEAVTNDDL